MKKFVKISHKLALVVPFCLFFVWGCQKDLNEMVTEKKLLSETSVTVSEAKAYFEKHFQKSSQRESHKHNVNDILKNKIPVWDDAYNKKISFGEAVVVPLDFEDLNLVVNKEGAYVPYNQLNYLMIYKDNKTRMKIEWVSLLPDSSWLYGNKDVYTGNILVRNWNGDYVKMYKYKKDGTHQSFGVKSLTGANETKNNRTYDSRPTFTHCMNVRTEETCTCQDKSDCDMCEICAPRVCYTVTLITEPYTPPGGTDGTTGTQIPIGSSSYGGSGNSGDNSGGNYLNQCNPNIPPGTNVPSNQLPPCTPITLVPTTNLPVTPVSYTEAELQTIIENLNDPVTGEGISLFLVENYRGTKAVNAVYSQVAGENITVGDYTLAKNYDNNGNLISYYAWRNGTNGIEYMIKANQLNAFRDNIAYYTSAANLVYFNGPPSRSMIRMMSGDYVSGLVSMWGEALTDPNYYIYVANVLVMSSTNVKPNNITYRNVTTGVSIPNFEITSHSYSEYMALIQQKQGSFWRTSAVTPQGNVQVLEIGDVKFTARPFASNSNYNLTIEYWRKGSHIGDFRFSH